MFMNFNLEKVNILDCTLRDGGYVNDFTFGKDVISGFLNTDADVSIFYRNEEIIFAESVPFGFIRSFNDWIDMICAI